MKRSEVPSSSSSVSRLWLRWPVLALFAMLLVFAGAWAATVSFSTDYTIFFSPDDPERVAFTEMESRFSQTDNFVFVVHSPDGDVFDQQTLSLVESITERATQIPFARRVDSLSNFPRASSDEEDLWVRPLAADAADKTPGELADIRAYAQGEPLLAGGLLSEDLHATGVVVTLELPREDPMEVRQSADVARAILAEAQAEAPHLNIRMSGLAAMNDAFMAVSIDDLSQIVPVMYLGMILLLLLLLRSARATAAVAAVVTVSCAVAMGVAGAFGIPLTPPSASAPTIVMTLAIADCVHLYVAARHARASGLTNLDAIWTGLRETIRPIFLTSLTTLVGFLALNFAESAPFWHLGNMAAMGILTALVASLTLFPALLTFIDIPPLEKKAKISFALTRLATRALGRPLFTAVACVGLLVFGAISMTRLVSNEDFVGYFDSSVDFRADTDFMVEHLTGIYALEYVLDSGEAGAVVEPEYLAHVDALAHFLRDQPEVRHVHSFSDVILAAGEGFSGQRELPQTREMAAQTFLLYEMSLPAGTDLSDRIDVERRRTRLSATVGDLSTQELRALEARSEAWLREHTPEAMHTQATSPVMIFSKLTERNTRAMIQGNLATLVVISFFMILVLRRKRLGFASLIPNLAPMVAAYGVWALVVEDIGIVGAVAGSVCLGIIVDDTIHVLTRYESYRKQGLSVDDSLKNTLEAVVPALVVTSLVLAAGFSALTFSSFEMNVHLGAISAMVIIFALVADVFFLPSIIKVVENVRLSSPLAPFRGRRNLRKESTMTQRTLSFLKILFVATLVLTAAPVEAQRGDQGENIARQVAQRTGGFGDFEAQLTMEASVGATARQLRLRALETDEGTHSLVLFDGPSDVRGTTLLSRQAGDEPEQWLYLPAMRRSRRVASGQLSASFLGSQFAYEDIGGISTQRYRWSLLGEGNCVRGSGDVCHQLESRPRFEGSGYARRVLHVDKDHFRVRRVEYFNASGTRVKTLVNSEWRQHAGRYWRAHRWVMTNHQNDERTTIRVADYSFGNGFQERDFSRNALGRVR